MGRKSNNAKNALMWALAIAVVGMLGYGIYMMSVGGTGTTKSADITTATESGNVLITQDVGKSATVNLNAYTGEWAGVGAQTEVYPIYTLVNGEGTKVHEDVGLNSSTSFAVGDSFTVFGTGGSYYVDAVEVVVDAETMTAPEIQAYDITETTDLVITCYDGDTADTALTADDHANNTADYAGGDIGADENNEYLCKLKNNAADETFRLGAILTYYCGAEVDNFELVESDWEEVSIPSGDLQNTFDIQDDTATNTSCSLKHAYVPKAGDFVELNEWEDTGKLSFVLDADATEPTANGDSYVGVVFVDFAYERDGAGNVVGGWYRDDVNKDVDDIGLNEGLIAFNGGYNGLDVGVCIEPQ